MTRLLASRHLLLLDLSKENEAMITGRSRMGMGVGDGDGGGGWGWGWGVGGPSQVEAQTFFEVVYFGLGLVYM